MTERFAPIPGPTNSLHDVSGLLVGHATLDEPGWLTGTTVILTGRGGAIGGVDARGGAPGTRETDLLDPSNLVERVHAVVLTGGSAFGLAAADGVMACLACDGIGFPIGRPGDVVPIVPAAVIFDLGLAGPFGHRPDAATGRAAYVAASAAPAASGRPRLGNVGGGTGATTGCLKGGFGTASERLPDGSTVAAVVLANPHGSVVDPATGELFAAPFLVSADLPEGVSGLRRPTPEALASARARVASPDFATADGPSFNTTIAVVATDVVLTKAQCRRLASVGHDGLARAIRPCHSMFDGDTIFGLSTVERPAPDALAFHRVLSAAADVLTRAIGRAVLHATGIQGMSGLVPAYADVLPSALLR